MIPMILLFDDDYDWLHFLCLQVSLLLCSKQFYCCQNSIVPHTTTNPGGQECAKNICTLLCAMFPILYFIHESRFEILLLVPVPRDFLSIRVCSQILLVRMLTQRLFKLWLLQSMEIMEKHHPMSKTRQTSLVTAVAKAMLRTPRSHCVSSTDVSCKGTTFLSNQYLSHPVTQTCRLDKNMMLSQL